jgi:5-methylcytosine-specific restriction endonuclease McrA
MKPETKTCSKCECQKSVSEFSPNAYWCKQCKNEYQRKWLAEHPEYQRKWYKEHPEQVRAYKVKYRKEHPEQSQIYDDKRRGKRLDYFHNYFQTAEGKISRKNSNHNRRTKVKGQKITLAEWTAIKEQQKYHCYWCKQKFPESKLTMDHVIALKRGGLNDASNIVASCQLCNSKKYTQNWSLV